MLPQKKTDPEDGRGGFEVRVIGGGTAFRPEARTGGTGAETGVVIGGRVSRPSVAPEEDEAPVLRLEVEQDGDSLKVKSTSEVAPASPAQPSEKRGKKRRGLQHWTLWMAAACVGITILAVGAVMFHKKSSALASPPPHAAPEEAPVVLTPEEIERDFFVSHASELISASESILRRYAAARSAEEVLPLVRDPERVRASLSAKWKPWGVEPPFASSPITGGVDATGLRPNITLMGSKGDYSGFEAFFVRENGKVVLDWEATAGIGDLQIPELKAGAGAKNSVVRGFLYPSDFFTSEYPEGEYASYKLTDASGENVVWLYAAAGSEVAEQLKTELNEGSYLIERSSRLAGTFKVSGPGTPGGDRYLITEMLHKGWVSP